MYMKCIKMSDYCYTKIFIYIEIDQLINIIFIYKRDTK